jgi:ABC-2 type transport system ATP-binding protein
MPEILSGRGDFDVESRMTALLEVKQLSRSFGALKAVDNLSFEVERGEAFGLLGPNGAGKSTTMMMICGVLAPDAGEIRVDGRILDGRVPESRSRMGVVPQDLAIYPDLSARENLLFFGRLYHLGGRQLRERVDEVLDQVGLLSRAADHAHTFSGGMKRRLNFAAAILHSPILLILDEPTVGVDPQSRAHLMECIRHLQQSGTAIIYASHYMEEVQALCGRVAIIDHGQLQACDRISRLLQRIPLEVEVRLAAGSVPGGLEFGPEVQLGTEEGEVVLRLTSEGMSSETPLNQQITQLLNILANHSINVRSIRTHDPSLERLFLRLTGHRLRD